MKRKQLIMVAAAITMIAAATAFVVLHGRQQPADGFPAALRSGINYGIFYPKKTDGVDRASISYDTSRKLLVYTYAVSKGGAAITVSQQVTPDSFAANPDEYAKLVKDMESFAVIETVNGTVNLTKSKVEGSKQIAVMNQKGTLLFAQASSDISQDDWRTFCNGLALLD